MLMHVGIMTEKSRKTIFEEINVWLNSSSQFT